LSLAVAFPHRLEQGAIGRAGQAEPFAPAGHEAVHEGNFGDTPAMGIGQHG